MSFSGALSGPQLSGQLSIDGQQLKVAATVGTGTVSGTFTTTDGRRIGGFAAKTTGTQLEGTNDLNGEAGRWSIPLSELPAAARTLLQ
ncbi:MAG: hypothetical protein ACREQL_00685 [Candidatus Binatia bacterium]